MTLRIRFLDKDKSPAIIMSSIILIMYIRIYVMLNKEKSLLDFTFLYKLPNERAIRLKIFEKNPILYFGEDFTS